VGPFSTVLLLLAVAYAVVRHQLFDIRVLLRKTLVLGIALSLVLAAYSALVLIATDKLASSESGGLTRFGVLVLAFSFDPVRRFLEKRIDRLLFSERQKHQR
jgi:two-component system, NarL family, sensor kinase